jgi:hypothetical protein
MTLHHGSSTDTPESVARTLDVLIAFAATRPPVPATESYDGPTPDVEYLDGSEADRRADLYYGDAR